MVQDLAPRRHVEEAIDVNFYKSVASWKLEQVSMAPAAPYSFTQTILGIQTGTSKPRHVRLPPLTGPEKKLHQLRAPKV